MKPTKENIKVLKTLGFVPEDKTNEYNEVGVWEFDGWAFSMQCMPNFKTLIKRLIRTNYNYGYDDGLGKDRRKYKPNDH